MNNIKQISLTIVLALILSLCLASVASAANNKVEYWTHMDQGIFNAGAWGACTSGNTIIFKARVDNKTKTTRQTCKKGFFKAFVRFGGCKKNTNNYIQVRGSKNDGVISFKGCKTINRVKR